MFAVPQMLRWVLAMQLDVLWMDTDVVALADPLPVLRDLLGANASSSPPPQLLASVDGRFPDEDPRECAQYYTAETRWGASAGGSKLCGGLFYLRHGARSLALVDAWEARLRGPRAGAKNQPHYNDAIVATGVAVSLLPCDLFPNGYRYASEAHLAPAARSGGRALACPQQLDQGARGEARALQSQSGGSGANILLRRRYFIYRFEPAVVTHITTVRAHSPRRRPRAQRAPSPKASPPPARRPPPAPRPTASRHRCGRPRGPRRRARRTRTPRCARAGRALTAAEPLGREGRRRRRAPMVMVTAPRSVHSGCSGLESVNVLVPGMSTCAWPITSVPRMSWSKTITVYTAPAGAETSQHLSNVWELLSCTVSVSQTYTSSWALRSDSQRSAPTARTADVRRGGVFGQTLVRRAVPVTAPMQTSMAEADAANVRRSAG